MTEHLVRHTVRCAAPAAEVFEAVAAVEHWPVLFAPTAHVEVTGRTTAAAVVDERFRITALVGDATRSWDSRRRLDRSASRIEFWQAHASPPFAAMSGWWTFVPVPGGTDVVLTHVFTPADSSSETLAWIHAALDRNSGAELEALRYATSSPFALRDLLISCECAVDAPAGTDLYGFVDDAECWALLLPHVEAATIDLDAAGAQHLALTVSTPDGDLHTTESVRVLTPRHTIRYKQTTPPVGLLGHSGEWEFTTAPDGRETAVSRHTALLDPAHHADHASLAAARERFATAFTANSRATLAAAARPAVGASP